MAQPLPHDPSGAPIPWEKFGEALAKGQAHFYANEKVTLYDPASKEWREATGADVGKYIQAGWQVPSPAAVHARSQAEAARAERQKVLMSPAEAGKALAEGYGRGLLPGVFDPVAGAIGGPGYTEGARKRAEIHSIPAAAGELHGLGSQVLGASVLSGGAAAPEAAGAGVSRVGAAVRALTLPGRALGAAGELGGQAALHATGAVGLAERAGLGARTVTGIVRGAGAGMGEGALLGGTQEVSRATLENRPLTAQKLWASIEHGAVVGGVAGGILGGATPVLSAAGRRAVDAVVDGADLNTALRQGAEKWQAKAALGNNQRMWNEATYFGRDPDRALRIGRKLLDSQVPGDVAKAAEHASRYADDAGRRMDELAKLRDGMADVGIEVDGARQALEAVKKQVARVREMPLGTFQDIARKLDDEVAPLQRAVDAGEPLTFRQLWDIRKAMYRGINYARDAKQPHLIEMREMARNFDDALDAEMGKLGAPPPGPSPLERWLKAKEDFHDFRTAADGYTAEATRIGKNRFYSPTDHAIGLAAGMATGQPLLGLAAGQANKLMRERGPAAMARLMDRIAQVDMRMNAATQSLLGDATPQVRKLAAREPLLSDKDINKEFARRQRDLLAVSQDGAVGARRLGAVMTDLEQHEDVASDLGMMFQRAHAYLTERLPKPLTRQKSSLTPLLEPSRVSRSEKLKWLEVARAVDDPIGAIVRDAKKGRISRQTIETVKAVYPDLFAEWRDRVEMAVKRAEQQGEPLPYRRRVWLSLAFDFNGDKSLEADFMASIQQAHAITLGAIQQQAQVGGGGGGSGQQMQTQEFKYHTAGAG